MPENNSREAVIVEGFRSPFVKSGQDFKNMPAEELGACVLRELMIRTQISTNEVEEVIIGQAINSPGISNIAYSVASGAGLPRPISTTGVQKMDISSLQSLISSAIKIQFGLANTLIAGGVENMSKMPIVLGPKLTDTIKNIIQSKTWKERMKSLLSLKIRDIKIQFADRSFPVHSLSFINRKKAAEILSENFHLTRNELDEFTLTSFQRACLAQKQGKYKEEIVPVFPPADFEMVEKDTEPDNKPSMHYLSELSPCVNHYGTITSGNSSSEADGAVLFLLMNKEKAKNLGYQPLVAIRSFACAGVAPHNQGLGPVCASQKALKKAGLQIKDIGLFEIDESFSAQTLACLKAFNSSSFAEKYLQQSFAMGEVNPEKCNVNGGALALGHPLSVTAARMVLNLAKEMKRQQVEWGLAASGMCEGQAAALILQNIF